MYKVIEINHFCANNVLIMDFFSHSLRNVYAKCMVLYNRRYLTSRANFGYFSRKNRAGSEYGSMSQEKKLGSRNRRKSAFPSTFVFAEKRSFPHVFLIVLC